MTEKHRLIDTSLLSPDALLSRKTVEANQTLLSMNILDKTVMITGAGGSIGAELSKQVLLQKPACLILYDHSEFGLYQIERELSEISKTKSISVKIVYVLGSILNKRKIRSVLSQYSVYTLYHAAAYKHVPLIQNNVCEGVRNNVYGTYVLAEAACQHNVRNFILISTDKAVRPTSFMGASKRLSELVCQAFAFEFAAAALKTVFSMVRFGNVLGSSGSVSHVFEKQIAKGGPITLTNPDVTRYFMTMTEAAQLVIQAGAMSTGGDVFVLDMGEPVKIIDLAIKMAALAGLRAVLEPDAGPGEDEIEIVISGLRPGEKLYEELLIKDDAQPTRHPGIMTSNEHFMLLDELKPVIHAINRAAIMGNDDRIIDVLKRLPIDFNDIQQ